jgi:hypothetical protein
MSVPPTPDFSVNSNLSDMSPGLFSVGMDLPSLPNSTVFGPTQMIDLTNEPEPPLLQHTRLHPLIVGVKRRLFDTDSFYIDLTEIDEPGVNPPFDDEPMIGIAYEETVIGEPEEDNESIPSTKADDGYGYEPLLWDLAGHESYGNLRLRSKL